MDEIKHVRKRIDTEPEKEDICDIDEINNLYSKKCGLNNTKQLSTELENRKELGENPDENEYLYPSLDDPNFIIKIAQKKEFSDTKYDGAIYDVEKYSNILKNAEYELLPQQAFVRNFLSFQTPYNSLLLFHGLGSGKTCSAIGVCEEMHDYLKQMGINKRIIIVASPNVQDNFKLQLFDERKLQQVDGIWTMKGCLGNKLLKEINPTGMKGLTREKVIQQVKNLIKMSYSFQGYVQFSNEIANKSGKNETLEAKIRNLEIEYSNSLIVIDEVHNIRISDDNENKTVAKNLMFLVSVVSNIRLLLLSATPMFNSYKEIIWILNLLNMNDRRGIISVSDIFDKHGDWEKNKDGEEIGKELLIRKATGYISYVRGENPYTFPFRVYPDRFAYKHTFQGKIYQYPTHQINGRRITEKGKEYPVKKFSLFLTAIGNYQQLGYKYIVTQLRGREESYKRTKTGIKKITAFKSLTNFSYTDLQLPIEALNIIYPHNDLEELVKKIPKMTYLEEEEKEIDDIAPQYDIDVDEEIISIMDTGPIIEKEITMPNSELESEPAVTEGLDADATLINADVEADARDIPTFVSSTEKKKTEDSIFNAIDEDVKELPGPGPSVISNKLSAITTEQTITELQEKLKDCEKRCQVKPRKPRAKKIIEMGETRMGEREREREREMRVKLVRKKKPPKNKETIDDSGLHIIEGITKSQMPSVKNVVKEDEDKKQEDVGGGLLFGGKDTPPDPMLNINPKDLTGSQGLRRMMDYVDDKTKGEFKYKNENDRIFSPKEIGKYSSKIKNICDSIYNEDTKKVSEGIILVYSSYIDAGIIPVALTLEEMGFTRYGDKSTSLFATPPTPVVDVRTMKPPDNKNDFKPARYIIISGDTRISPNNDTDVKAITNNNNIFKEDENGNLVDISGEIIKVVLISQAGAEGLDFKVIRQVHILEPWYNINRNEQIIGRAVRNFSHKDLPFSKRNVQIFLYGTILENAEEEAVDLYVYRIAELKAVKMGRVTRLLKQTSVDCIINHDQTDLISKNFEKIEENQNITQILSDNQILKNFQIGDMDNSATCDFMECEFKCLPDTDLSNIVENTDTYNETFLLINSDKIIQKIKTLMKMRYFYKKSDLINLINIPKKYPLSQIYAALTQIINDNMEYITDKYGRTGYLVNIGEYYLFQPSELNYKNVSIHDRSVPINYKHDMINFRIKSSTIKPFIDAEVDVEVDEDKEDKEELINVNPAEWTKGKNIIDEMFNNYTLATSNAINVTNKNSWYELCIIVIRKMITEPHILLENTPEKIKETLEMFANFVVEHAIDSLMMDEKIDLLNYIYANKNKILFDDLKDKLKNGKFKRFYKILNECLLKKIIKAKKITGMVIFNGISKVDNLNIFVLNNNKWTPAEPQDVDDLQQVIDDTYKLKYPLSRYVGFIGFEPNLKYMVYQVKDTNNPRSTGLRCDTSAQNITIGILNTIESNTRFEAKKTVEKNKELCVRQELTLRCFNHQKLNDQMWFLDTETAIYNEFQKKEKLKK